MLLQSLKNQLQSKMSRDIGWSLGSFVILALSGIIINIVIAIFKDAQALGIFNQAYSFYIIISQIAVIGLHYSVLRNAALYKDDPEELGTMLFSALLPATIIGGSVAVIVYFSSPFIGSAFDSEQTGTATGVAALGLALFPLNKVLISFINGLREMKAFSFLQSTRYLLIAVIVCFFALGDLPFVYSTISFFIAELVTVVTSLLFILSRRLIVFPRIRLHWIKSHILFGTKGLLAGIFLEINTRVDVLMLGFFLSDTAVGIYSFAAMLFDGLYHLLALIRVNFNPYLVTALKEKRYEQIQSLFGRSRLYVPIVMAFFSLGIIAAFWILTVYLFPETNLNQGLLCLVILLGCLTLLSGYIPFDNLTLVGGHPGYQTVQQMLAVTANIVGNYLFIPLFGIEGAAIGTSLSYFASVIILIIMTKRFFQWNLIKNRIDV